jgi:hypothetical protein
VDISPAEKVKTLLMPTVRSKVRVGELVSLHSTPSETPWTVSLGRKKITRVIDVLALKCIRLIYDILLL